MENQVTFTQYAEAVPDDMNNLQQYVSDSIDHIVGDTLVPTVAYSGFNATKSGPAQVNIDPGRLYNSGKVYALTTPTPSTKESLWGDHPYRELASSAFYK